jgi:hypothetical protein
MHSRFLGAIEWVVAVGGVGGVAGVYQIPGTFADGTTTLSGEQLLAKWTVYLAILGLASAKFLEIYQRKLSIYRDSFQGRLEHAEAEIEQNLRDHTAEAARAQRTLEEITRDFNTRLSSKNDEIAYLKEQVSRDRVASTRKIELIASLNQQVIDQAITISDLAKNTAGAILQSPANTRAAIRKIHSEPSPEDSDPDLAVPKSPTQVVVVNTEAHPVPVTGPHVPALSDGTPAVESSHHGPQENR